MNTDKIYAQQHTNKHAPKDTPQVAALRNLGRKAKLPASGFTCTSGSLAVLIAGAPPAPILDSRTLCQRRSGWQIRRYLVFLRSFFWIFAPIVFRLNFFFQAFPVVLDRIFFPPSTENGAGIRLLHFLYWPAHTAAPWRCTSRLSGNGKCFRWQTASKCRQIRFFDRSAVRTRSLSRGLCAVSNGKSGHPLHSARQSSGYG